MTPSIDPTAQRADLERQLALLDPVLRHLREAAPRRIVPDDWEGPAARAAEGLADELRRRIDAAADGVDDLVRIVRLQLGAMP
ncbi:hypothetical protein [Pseudolysinimonas sp.]|jgi:hypothetical protein